MLVLQFAQALDRGHIHTAIFLAPLVEGILSNAVGATDARHGLLAGLRLAQDLHDLLFGERAHLHLNHPRIEAILLDQLVLITGGMSVSRRDSCADALPPMADQRPLFSRKGYYP